MLQAFINTGGFTVQNNGRNFASKILMEMIVMLSTVGIQDGNGPSEISNSTTDLCLDHLI